MNNDLISRSALLEKMSELNGWDEYNKGVGACHRLVDFAPAVDAESVRYGRWIGDDTVYCGAGKRWYKCTSCNERVFTAVKGSKGYRFCPNCEADMRGSEVKHCNT
jgi:hypothetical protein